MKNFKDSGIEWLGEIPQDWQIVPIRCCFGEFNARCNNNDYPLLSVTIANGVVYQNDITNKKDISNDDKSNYKIVPLGAIAYNKMRMWQGAIGINMLEKGIVSPAYVVAIPNKKININFSYYLLKSKNMICEYEKYSYGLCSDMNNLRYEDFQNIKIPLPPLKEQEQIANFLDEKYKQIANFIEKKEKLISLLKEQKQALINETITKGLDKNVNFKDSGIEWLGEIPQHWRIVKLKYVAFTNIGLVYSPDDIVENSDEGYPVLRANNIQNGKIDYQDLIYIKSKQIGKKQIISSGDLLMCIRNGSENLLGKTAKIQDENFSFGAFTAIIKSQFNDYFYWVFQTNMLRKSIASFSASNGIGQISQDDIKNFIISFPPLKEQEQIANFLDEKCEKIDLLIEKTKKQIKLIKEYKTTLINQAVCGRIDL
ncbi:restriction endonuclease subunit S [Campylobacter jejuni]|nr:restriction endonuclease subunit S [Campylobacter jejuni]